MEGRGVGCVGICVGVLGGRVVPADFLFTRGAVPNLRVLTEGCGNFVAIRLQFVCNLSGFLAISVQFDAIRLQLGFTRESHILSGEKICFYKDCRDWYYF